MIDLKIDDSGELVIEDNDLVFVSDLDQVMQHVKIRLRTFYGEWVFDTTRGIKYFEEIFVKQPNKSVVDGLIKQAIIETAEVTELVEYSSVIDEVSRQIDISATINTIYGTMQITEVLQ